MPTYAASATRPEPVKGEVASYVWLEDFLASGPKPIAEIRTASSAAGFSWSTIKSARNLLMVTSPQTGIWALPKEL